MKAIITLQIFAQNVAEGPGTATTTSHLTEILIMLVISVGVGFLAAWLMLSKYKVDSKTYKAQLDAALEEKRKNAVLLNSIPGLENKLNSLRDENNELNIKLNASRTSEASNLYLKTQITELEATIQKLQDSLDQANAIEEEPDFDPDPEPLEESNKLKAFSDFLSSKQTDSTDLKKIEGIGPKIQEILNDHGIETYSDLATYTPEQISEILIKVDPQYKMHDPATWPKQALMAQNGKWSELSAWQSELKGGKTV